MSEDKKVIMGVYESDRQKVKKIAVENNITIYDAQKILLDFYEKHRLEIVDKEGTIEDAKDIW